MSYGSDDQGGDHTPEWRDKGPRYCAALGSVVTLKDGTRGEVVLRSPFGYLPKLNLIMVRRDSDGLCDMVSMEEVRFDRDLSPTAWDGDELPSWE